MRRALSCPACGGNRLSLRYTLTDASDVWCLDCSQSLGSLGDLKRRVAANWVGPEEDLADE